MDSKILILHAKKWEMVDEVTHAVRAGVSLHYVMTDKLVPLEDEDVGEMGYAVTKESISLDLAKKLTKVPAVYNAEFILRGRSGKNILVIGDLECIG